MASTSSNSVRETSSKSAVAVKDTEISVDPTSSEECQASQDATRARWWKFGVTRSTEQKLLFKLDLYIMSWACFGYFLRLLDTSNMSTYRILFLYMS